MKKLILLIIGLMVIGLGYSVSAQAEPLPSIMQTPWPWYIELIFRGLATLGGVYGLYKILSGRWEAKEDIKRINKLVEEDLLPLSMKDKRIKSDEYILVCMNMLTRVIDKNMQKLNAILAELSLKLLASKQSPTQ